MKLSLGRKLGIGFAIVSLLTVCSAMVTYWKISAMRATQDYIITVRVPALTYGGDLIAQSNQSVSKLREYTLMADDAQLSARSHDQFDTAEKKQDKDLQQLKEIGARFTSPVNRERIDKLQERNLELAKLKEEVFRMRKANNPASEDATAKYLSDVVTPFNDASKAIAQEMVNSFNEFIIKEGQDASEAAASAALTLLLSTLLVVCLGIGIAIYLGRSISNGVNSILQRAKAIADGDLSGKPLVPETQDEVAELALAMNEMTGSLRSLVGNISTGVQTLGSSATQLSAVSAQTASGVSSMSEKANGVAAAAEQASASTMSVASGMEESSSSLSSVASATEEMSATVGDIASNTARARATSEQATSRAVTISEQMQKLGLAAQEIGQVTETITNISAQTNLLALNATIEAARAGAAGKGFAVVANEIKELARQTAEATEDIKARIAGVQSSTGAAISDIDQITTVIKEVGGIVSSIAAAIEEQAAVTKDVAGNIAQASAGVRDANLHIAETSEVSRAIARDIAGVNADVADIRRGGEQVQTSAIELSHLAEQLKTQVSQFRM